MGHLTIEREYYFMETLSNMHKKFTNLQSIYTNNSNVKLRIANQLSANNYEIALDYGADYLNIFVAKYDDLEYLYNINTYFAPSGVYTKDLRAKEEYAQRDNEIMILIENIIHNEINVISKPNKFNNKQGYIPLIIDGLKTEYWVK